MRHIVGVLKLVNQMKIYSKDGFTIIELIVVIFLAGFLSALSIPSVLNWKRSQDVNAYTRELSQFIRLVRKDSRRWGATCDLKVKQLINSSEGNGFFIQCDYGKSVKTNFNCEQDISLSKLNSQKECRLNYLIPSINKKNNIFQIVSDNITTTPNGRISNDDSITIIIGSVFYNQGAKQLNCLLVQSPSGQVKQGKYSTILVSNNMYRSRLDNRINKSNCIFNI